MMRDAESHAAEDVRRKEEIEARNMADSTVYGAEKFLADNGDKIPESNKADVRARIDEVKTALGNNDPAAMQQAAQRLEQALQQAGSAMYQAGAAGPQDDGNSDGGPSGNGGADEDVVEGEFSDAN